jgi:hypothetical protein
MSNFSHEKTDAKKERGGSPETAPQLKGKKQ